MSLEGRMAKCAYGCAVVPSREGLAFFVFKGKGSKVADETCKHCGYYECAHKKGSTSDCKGFEAVGEFEFDQYYCGCYGWD